MKKLSLSLLVCFSLSACEKKCTEFSANDFVNTYQNSSGTFMVVTKVNDSQIRIDNHFSASLTGCGEFDVVEQTYQHAINGYDIAVSGNGKMVEEDATNNGGQIALGETRIDVNLTYQFQGQTVNDNSSYYPD